MRVPSRVRTWIWSKNVEILLWLLVGAVTWTALTSIKDAIEVIEASQEANRSSDDEKEAYLTAQKELVRQFVESEGFSDWVNQVVEERKQERVEEQRPKLTVVKGGKDEI